MIIFQISQLLIISIEINQIGKESKEIYNNMKEIIIVTINQLNEVKLGVDTDIQ